MNFVIDDVQEKIVHRHCPLTKRGHGFLKALDRNLRKHLVELRGLLVDSWDRAGYTAVMWCAQNGHVDALRFCLANGCSSVTAGYDGVTPLLFA